MKGKIICLKADLFKVMNLDTKATYNARASKIFQKNKQDLKVGDFVEFDELEKGKAYITKLYPRVNDLVRPSIANIDLAIIATSVKEPEFNDNLLDRFLTILSFNNIDGVILFTKWDLLNDEEQEKMNDIVLYYESIGYKVLKTSTKDENLEKVFKELVNNKECVITGQSGVGKSSLLNLLNIDLNLETNDISKALNRGKHTTRHVELIPILGGWIADTPGFGTMEFIGMEEIDIAQSFSEFFKVSSLCKFKGCLHLNEPNCEVKKLIQDKQILESRYNNYLQFIEEVKKQRKW